MATPGPPSRRLIRAAMLFALWLSPAQGQDRVAQLQAQFQAESNPVRKAKALSKLAEAQWELMHRAIVASDYAQALRILQQYRDEVRAAEAALKASGVDAERKPAGFKQLQIHLRKSLRDLDQTILAMPEDQREPFEAVRRELTGIDEELVGLLFPRRPGQIPEAKKPKG